MSSATAIGLAIAHLSSELSSHAGGVGDGVATAEAGGSNGFPFHVVYNISELRNDPGLNADDGMMEVLIQVTTASTTRQLRDLAAEQVAEAMIVTQVSSGTTLNGETLTVIGRTFDSRSNDDQREGSVYSTAQRFLWLCAVA